MIEWLKWIFAKREMQELERWRIYWHQHRQWFAEFEVAAVALDHLKAEIEGDPVTNIHVVRNSCRDAAVLNGFALRQVLEVLDDLSAGKYCDIAGELTGDGYRVIDSLAHNLRRVLAKDESHGTH